LNARTKETLQFLHDTKEVVADKKLQIPVTEKDRKYLGKLRRFTHISCFHWREEGSYTAVVGFPLIVEY
jgi:ribosome maturation protein Sdo1